MDASATVNTPTQDQHTEKQSENNILQSLSPERVNRRPMLPPPTPSSVPCSPAPSIGSPSKSHIFQDPFLSSRRGSDVQGKVAQFNSLSGSDSLQKAELQKALERARLGREQAETENETLRGKIETYEDRERKVGLRLEESMEENEKLRTDLRKVREKYERAKDALTHSKERFREELRRVKGAEFKADSNQLAAQQALQSERQLIKSLETELKYTRDKHDKVEKESFTTQIKLLELDEQLSKVQQQMKLVEEERDALRTSLKGEEVARIAAEGRIPLPIPSTPDEFSSPKKSRDSHIPTPIRKRMSRPILADPFVGNDNGNAEEVASLKRQLEIESLSRKSAEDLVNFMKLECQLQRCSCRLAEFQGVEYVCDEHFHNVIADLEAEYQHVSRQLLTIKEAESSPVAEAHQGLQPQTLIDLEDAVEFSPETGTFRKIESPQKGTLKSTNVSDSQAPSPEAEALRSPPPTFVTESPAAFASFETPNTLQKISIEACQILPGIPQQSGLFNVGQEDLTPRPATPKGLLPRMSDADLLSFTPFAIPNLTPETCAPEVIFNPAHRAPILTQQAQPREEGPLKQVARVHSSLDRDCQREAHVRPRSRQEPAKRQPELHSASFPPPEHKTHFSSRPHLPPSRSATSQSHHHPQSHKIYTIQTTTTTIPLAEEPTTPTSKTLPKTITNSSSAPAQMEGLAYSPGTTLTREDALARIRGWREGNAQAAMANRDTNAKMSKNDAKPRSRSVVLAATPGRRKAGGDRDISAPVIR